MKIAIVVFEMQHALSGFIPYVEDLYLGFKAAGHKPTLFYIVHKEPSGRDLKEPQSFEQLQCGLYIRVLQDRGLLGANPESVWVANSNSTAGRIQEELSNYDLVIVASYPFKWRFGDLTWVKAIRVKCPKFLIIHTAWDIQRKPWLCLGEFTNYIAVSPGVYHTSQIVPGYISCIVNPFDVTPAESKAGKLENFLCVTSMYVSWKHIPHLIRSIPYLKPCFVFSTGGGIVKDMLTSKNPKPEYLWKEGDPGFKRKWEGRKIWDIAIETKRFSYMGFVSKEIVRDIQARCQGLVDLSKRSGAHDHFYRPLIEACVAGCVPFVRRGAVVDENGRGVIFQEKNVVFLPEECDPIRTAKIVKETLANKNLVKEMIARNRELVKVFDRKRVAKDLVSLASGDFSVGILPTTHGEPSDALIGVLAPYDQKFRFPRFRRFPRKLRKK